jgi:hypothetical protein
VRGSVAGTMDRIEKLYRTIRTSYDVPRPHLKKNIQCAGFFRYFFMERGKIRRWNENLGLIKHGFLGLSIGLHPSFKLKLDELYITCILPVSVYLKEILENGWQHQVLSIREYNLIVCFEDFAMKLESIQRERQLAPKQFRLLEESFLRLVSNERDIYTLVDGLSRVFEFYRKKFFRKDEEPGLRLSRLNNFFLPHALIPSLYDIITAYNMIETSRYLDFSDIIVRGVRDVVSSRFYACSLDVFARIVKYLSGLSTELAALEKGKKKIEWLKRHFASLHATTPPILVSFYESLGHVWRTDADDVFLLIVLLLDGIIGRIENAIADVWRVMDTDEKIINVRLVTTPEMTELLEEARREHELAHAKHSVAVPAQTSLEDYLESKKKDKPYGDDSRAYIHKRVETIFTLLRALAEQLNDLYEKRDTNLARLLNFMIVSPEKWRGKPVYDVYLYYVELILAVCAFFREKKLLI